MREIKFRAWNKQTRRMEEVKQINFFDDEMLNGRFIWYSLRHAELLQYTGLKDINGTEIYEGDIVLIRINETSIQHKTIVNFKKGAFIGNLIGDKKDYIYIFHHGFSDDNFEIIGNIYENPELLGEG